LTLPKDPSELDDGLLTASEVAQLKLNADWVVLSACNTAAGEKPGAEALSGFARAFFYAGARALLVSHWRIDSKAAIRAWLPEADLSNLRLHPAAQRAIEIEQPGGRTDKRGQFVLPVNAPAPNADSPRSSK
jgi:hypothetical protein